ncbi:MAG: DUF1015 domain-containing protein [FCB group bacterium]|nr:DUF1015 domain-containing protein [FCB group bacterium]
MATIKPFRGLRPKPELAREIVTLPYDVLTSEEARTLIANNPHSFLRVNKPEVDFDANISIYSDEVYQRGKENLYKLIEEKILIRDEEPCFYLYRLTMDNKSQTGIVALTSVDEYNRGIIKKHEHTRPEKVNDRARHILTLNAQVGPVFSIFKHHREIKSLFDRLTSPMPNVDFTVEDGVRHELWVIKDDASQSELQKLFAQLDELYIADGHHRSQAAAEVCRQLKEKNLHHTGNEIYNYFLNVIFPDNELNIIPYNRVVKDLHGLSLQEMLEKAKKYFYIQHFPARITSIKNHQIGLYCEGQWYLLMPEDNTYDAKHPVNSMDSAILTNNLLAPILGITDIRTDKRIDFVGGLDSIDKMIKMVDNYEYKAAFMLPPVTVEQLIKIADADEVMPPKSTWFEPKLRSGMVVNLLSE